MLDADELSKRVRAAMDLREPPLASVELAAKCGVTKQAVYGWRTTGRMSKAQLLTVSQETGMPLEFFLEADRGTTPTTKAIWRRMGRAMAKAAMVALVLALQYVNPPSALAYGSESYGYWHTPVCIMLNRIRTVFLHWLVRWLTVRTLHTTC